MKLKKNIAVSESGFVFDPTSGDSFSLNSIGLEIVGMLRHGKTDSEILAGLLDKYDIDKGSLDKYYHDFVAMLQYYRLIDETPVNGSQAKDGGNMSAE
jgi:hypothetical protein